ncbi:MAG: acetate--CoA ligase family protein, partial [Micrococcales bacterium]|nr:acetate--CoA ligase family protein [Micrococcales bacterium]
GEPVDMAVIAVPAERVLDVVDDCAAAKVKTLLVLSSGFAETGELGAARQTELLTRARRGGMRVVGPNSYGLVNNDPAVRLNATIARILPYPGTLGVFSQSGGLGVGLLAGATQAGLGLSVFASAGNRVDVSGNDVMQYLIDDDSTTTVALYLESVGNPRKFSRIARQLSKRKPVVAVKSPTAGAVPPGHRARASLIGPQAFEALLAQAGVIATHSVRDLIHVCLLLAHQPIPHGDHIAVVGTSPGLNAITAEAARMKGLRVVGEPVTLPTQASPRQMAEAFEAAFAHPEADMLSITLTAPLTTSEEEIARTISHIAGGFNKPCVTSFVGTRDVADVMQRAGRLLDPRTGQRSIVPVYESPLNGIAALSAAWRYAKWQRSDQGHWSRPAGLNRGVGNRIVADALAQDPQGRRLSVRETTDLLAAYGLDLHPMIPVATAEEAIEAAKKLGYPVVVRSLIESVRFRPGAGGESGDETTPDGLVETFDSMSRRLVAFGDPQLVVQATVPAGMATIVSSTEDPLFGPVVSFGPAGPVGELLSDYAHRIPPLTDVDVRELVSDLRVSPLLKGYRGSEPVDTPALENVIARVAALADEIPEVYQLVLDYVNARPGGVDIMGAQVDVAPAAARSDAGRRALS